MKGHRTSVLSISETHLTPITHYSIFFGVPELLGPLLQLLQYLLVRSEITARQLQK